MVAYLGHQLRQWRIGEVVPEPCNVGEPPRVDRQSLEAALPELCREVGARLPQHRGRRDHTFYRLVRLNERLCCTAIVQGQARQPDVGAGLVQHALLEAALKRPTETGGEDAKTCHKNEQQRKPRVVRRIPRHLPQPYDDAGWEVRCEQAARHAHHQREQPEQHYCRGYQNQGGDREQHLIDHDLSQQVSCRQRPLLGQLPEQHYPDDKQHHVEVVALERGKWRWPGRLLSSLRDRGARHLVSRDHQRAEAQHAAEDAHDERTPCHGYRKTSAAA